MYSFFRGYLSKKSKKILSGNTIFICVAQTSIKNLGAVRYRANFSEIILVVQGPLENIAQIL